VLEFNPPWNLIANRGEIAPNQNRGEAAVGVKNSVYTIWRERLEKVRTFYQENHD